MLKNIKENACAIISGHSKIVRKYLCNKMILNNSETWIAKDLEIFLLERQFNLDMIRYFYYFHSCCRSQDICVTVTVGKIMIFFHIERFNLETFVVFFKYKISNPEQSSASFNGSNELKKGHSTLFNHLNMIGMF